MLFNSVEFPIFLIIVYFFYWFVSKNRLKLQNNLLLFASYYFYSCWDWRFLFLLIFSTLLDYFTGIKMQDARSVIEKKFWFWLSVSINLGFLGVFKYFNFFAESFSKLLSQFGLETNFWTLQIILPVGISFYTFHGLSYVIDIYKDRIKAERSFVDYALFVSFFPLLVAGPIERATHLLPQIKRKRVFDYSKSIDGLRQILWGLFKKVVIADNCAQFANQIFDHSGGSSGSVLFLGAIFFAFQIYGDFSGYSDIALGTARLLGIELLKNFSFPYFSRDIAEFWRRWHISLSSWFRDYLYIPLGGSKGGLGSKIRNTFIIFIVSGFWHGANWTFVLWGMINAIYFLPLLLTQNNRNNLEVVASGKMLPTVKEAVQMLITFILVVFAWVLFRSKDVSQAIQIFDGIFSFSLFSFPKILLAKSKVVLILLAFFVLIEWVGRGNEYAIQKLGLTWKKPIRWVFYLSISTAILLYFGKAEEFIYFQF